MNILPFPQQVEVVSLLTEGMSMRATARETGVDRNTIMRLNQRVGDGCHRLHHARMRDLQCARLELDETWGFVGKKQKNVQDHDPPEAGDAYLWLALDVHTKLIISYLVGKRTAESAQAFLADVRRRVINRPQIVTDAFAAYEDAVEAAFGSDVDYVMMNKKAGGYPVQIGQPDLTQVTTNHVERANLTIRTHLRRHTRRTNGHSKKLAPHRDAIALLIAYYNFCRVCEPLRVSPAIEMGLTDHIWSVGELLRATEEAPPIEPITPPAAVYPQPGRRPFKLIVGGRNTKVR